MQDTYPYMTEYGIAPVNTAVGDETPRLYFISAPLACAGATGHVFYNIYKETETFKKNDVESAVKTYFAEYARITKAPDIAAALKESALLGAGMLVSQGIGEALSLGAGDIISDADVVTDISDMTHDELYSKDIRHFARVNAARLAALPAGGAYSKDELDAFCSTFFNIIKQYKGTKVTDYTVTGKIYNAVIDYYAAGGSDNASSLIDLVLSSPYSYAQGASSSSTCGCSSSSGSSYSVDEPCGVKYDNAMRAWLRQMTGDIDYFYNKFFYIETTSETGDGVCYEPDTDLIDALVALIDEFAALGYDLSFGDEKSKFNICRCSDSSSSYASGCNYKTLENYKKLLGYIKDNDVPGNEAKITAYGTAMGEILYKMMF